ncbi:transcription regulatory protein OpdE [Sphingomonas astaxanthinifaciens DSM 22298]|uniref:Transcription regulatory protein OpdE n=1 Tax=Sphingomonas astaxanthinifaciens DSM 22298 TaxID=1123267 RepID=A0ABQ5Z4I9_9SPHN|nr:transcription regulatory protein OpdE [Sphingomonas astaxanthinifaciens DSM 22298]
MSLLTPVASSLQISEGQAGQAIAISGIFAVFTSLFIAAASRNVDRRSLLLGLTTLMVVSGAIVACAPNYLVFMAGRALLGVVIGGFWSMSTATVMRLVPEAAVPKALALLNGGNALATTIAAPLGSYLGQFIGWRGAFFCVVPLACVTLVWLFRTLPAMPNHERASGIAALRLLRRPQVPLGMLSVSLLFMGQFALFTYLRPFLESITGVGVTTLALILLVVGVAGLAGTYAIDFALRRSLYSLLAAMPLAMAAIAAGLVAAGHSPGVVTVLLVLWGFVGTAAPVAWWTWVSRVLPNDAEAGGGLMVAVVQLAITLGAGVGGILFDRLGYQATFLVSAALLISSAGAALLAARAPSNAADPADPPSAVFAAH